MSVPAPSAHVGSALWGAPSTARAIGTISLAALLFSLIPVSLDWFVDGTAVMTVGLGTVAGYVLATEADRRRLAKQLNAVTGGQIDVSYLGLWRHVLSPEVRPMGVVGPVLILILTGPDYLVFSASTVYVDTAVTSSLYELWPMLWLLGMIAVDAKRFGASARTPRPWHTYALMLLGVPALALIVTSTVSAGESTTPTSSFPLLGIVLAVAAPAMGALGVASFWFADRLMYLPPGTGETSSPARLHDRWRGVSQTDEASRTTRLLTNVLCDTSQTVGLSLSIVALAPLVVLEAGGIGAIRPIPLLGGIMVGAVLNGPGSVALRRAHVLTDRREIISLQYISPVLALLWLFLATTVEITRFDYLIIGTITIMVINVLISASSSSADRPLQADSSRPGT